MTRPPEFTRPYRIDTIGGEARAVHVEADAGERAALAERFGLVAIGRLEADATLRREGDRVRAEGRLTGDAVQRCVATGDPVPAHVVERFSLRFVPEAASPAATDEEEREVELDEADLDILPYDGGAIDLGEAVAQGFALALDPFPRVVDADERLRAAGVASEEDDAARRAAHNPFAALRNLAKK